MKDEWTPAMLVWEIAAHKLHGITHAHRLADGPNGIGEIKTCRARWSRRCFVYFRPNVYGARWVVVPGAPDAAVLDKVLGSENADAAIAVLRAAGADFT